MSAQRLGHVLFGILMVAPAVAQAVESPPDTLRSEGPPPSSRGDVPSERVNELAHFADALARFGADEDLVSAAWSCAVDTESTPSCRLGRSPVTSLLDLAIDNAAIGCVRETYGAMAMWHQAIHAEDVEQRETFRRIAEQETRHATLAWRIHAWATERLDDDARAEVVRARTRALTKLTRSLRADPSPELLAVGKPAANVALAMLEMMRRALAI
jgi:hypothetical protein